MKRKLMSLLLCVSMALTMVPMSAFATDIETAIDTSSAADTDNITNERDKEEEAKCVCESKCTQNDTNAECEVCKESFAECAIVEKSTEESTEEPVEKLSDSTVKEQLDKLITIQEGELAPGTYTLSTDVTLVAENLTIPANTEVTIDLNGHTLTGNGNGSVITVNGELTIQDSASNGKITGGSGNKTSEQSDETVGGGIYVTSTGKLTLLSGFINGNEATRGGGICIAENAMFVMSGGNISHNKATAISGAGGGGVWVTNNAKFEMSNGEISNNESAIQGGGVFSTGEITLTGGVICKNQAPAGGGVMAQHTFTMTGGKITENTATGGSKNIENGGKFGHALGGGVKTIGDFYLYGGEITGNKVINDGNTTYMYAGGGVHANWQSGGIHVKGTPIVSKNINVTSGGSSKADNIFFQYSEGKADVLLHLDGDVASGAVLPITKDGDLQFGWVVFGHGHSLASDTITSENDKKFQQRGSNIYFGSYPEGTVIGYIKDGSSKISCTSWVEFFALIGDEGTLYLKNDLVLSEEVAIPKNTDVTLTSESNSGVEITGPTVTNQFFSIPANSSLTLLGNITLTGNYNEENHTTTSSAQAFDVKGTLNLGERGRVENTSIIQKFSGGNGNAIYVNGGILNMYCGQLVNNHSLTAASMGGAIFATGNATLNVYAGNIKNNSSTSYGGGIGVNGSTLNMYGGTITENTSGNVGSGVHLYGTSFLNLYDGSISDNKYSDVNGVSHTNSQCSLNTASAMIVGGSLKADQVYFADSNAHVFYTNGGIFENKAVVMNTFPTPTSVGRVFIHWSKESTLENAETKIADKTVYYAKWEELAITLTDQVGENAFVYDSTGKMLVATLENTPDAEFTYTYARRTNADAKETFGEATSTAPINAGYYKVVASLSGTKRTATAYLEIKPAPLTVLAIKEASKSFDGTDTFENVSLTLSGVQGSDQVTATATAKVSGVEIGTYPSAHLTNIKVAGARGNYTITTPADAVNVENGMNLTITKSKVESSATTDTNLRNSSGDTPQTGDKSMTWLWWTLAVVSLLSGGAVLVIRKKRTK